MLFDQRLNLYRFFRDVFLSGRCPDLLSVQASDTEDSGFYKKEDSRIFDTELMLPALWEDRKEPSVFYFAPLHFKEKPYGYVVLECDLLQKKKLNVVHRNWIRYINNSLEISSDLC